jgi:hypothetical protein
VSCRCCRCSAALSLSSKWCKSKLYRDAKSKRFENKSAISEVNCQDYDCIDTHILEN